MILFSNLTCKKCFDITNYCIVIYSLNFLGATNKILQLRFGFKILV